MQKLAKISAVAVMAVGLVAATVHEAEASRRGRVIGGVAAGIALGAIIAGSSRAYARERTYYVAPSNCGEYRRQAVYNERIGRPGRAQYYWDQYYDCKG